MKENVEYIKVFADYESDDMPVVYLYEVDLEDERLALRAIEISIVMLLRFFPYLLWKS